MPQFTRLGLICQILKPKNSSRHRQHLLKYHAKIKSAPKFPILYQAPANFKDRDMRLIIRKSSFSDRSVQRST